MHLASTSQEDLFLFLFKPEPLCVSDYQIIVFDLGRSIDAHNSTNIFFHENLSNAHLKITPLEDALKIIKSVPCSSTGQYVRLNNNHVKYEIYEASIITLKF